MFKSVQITKIEDLTENVKAFYFKKDNTFSFLPGQYIELSLPEVSEFPTREFTISSSPLEKEYYRIISRKGETAFKRKLFSMQVGDEVLIKGPVGGFVLDEKDKRARILLSGGLGITPFYSMIVYAAAQRLTIPLTLFASFKERDDFLFYDELQEITKNNPTIRSVYTVSSKVKNSWNGEVGRISEKLLKKYIADFTQPVFLIAGPNQLVDDIQDLLGSLGVVSHQMKTEYFNGYTLAE